MAVSCQSVEETIAGILARRPVLGPVLNAFGPLLEARASLPETLKPLLESAGLRLPDMRGERASQGVPLLADESLKGIDAPLRAAAEVMLPLLAEQEAVKPYAAKLRGFSSAPGNRTARPCLLWMRWRKACCARMRRFWKKPPWASASLPKCCCSPSASCWGPSCGRWRRCGRAATERTRRGTRKAHGDRAMAPSAAPTRPSRTSNAPCSRRTRIWRAAGARSTCTARCAARSGFSCRACPSCGKEGNDVVEMLRNQERARQNAFDWYASARPTARAWTPRERHDADLDALALDLLHLDMVAAGPHPINPSFLEHVFNPLTNGGPSAVIRWTSA